MRPGRFVPAAFDFLRTDMTYKICDGQGNLLTANGSRTAASCAWSRASASSSSSGRRAPGRSSSGITLISLLKATAPGRNIRRLVRRQAA